MGGGGLEKERLRGDRGREPRRDRMLGRAAAVHAASEIGVSHESHSASDDSRQTGLRARPSRCSRPVQNPDDRNKMLILQCTEINDSQPEKFSALI
jgi:hypothetical protein